MRSVSGGKRGDGKDGPSLPGRPKRAKQGPGAAATRAALVGTGLLGWLATAAPRVLVVPYSTSATLARRTFVALRCGEPFLRLAPPGTQQGPGVGPRPPAHRHHRLLGGRPPG